MYKYLMGRNDNGLFQWCPVTGQTVCMGGGGLWGLCMDSGMGLLEGPSTASVPQRPQVGSEASGGGDCGAH